MKHLFLLIVTLVVSVTLLNAGTPINQYELPQAAQVFLNRYFAGDDIRKAEKEQGRRGMEYEVELRSGAEIEFRDNGDWTDVKSADGQVVPNDIIPEAIAQYVSENYEGQTIVQITRKRGGFEVELSNDTELKLTEDAKPLPERPMRRHRARR